jgi:large subunit ribosomal protein L10e
MAATRKALAYSKRKPVVNTRRSKKQQLSYIKTVPPHKIVKFNMGNVQAYDAGRFPLSLALLSAEPVQIRDLAIEAVRQSLHKDLAKLLTIKHYFLQCNVYPHNILRNNRIFSGGSKGERVQTGMRKSFGSPEGRAAIVKKGHAIFTVHFADKEHIPKIKTFFSKVKPKVPCSTKVRVDLGKKN